MEYDVSVLATAIHLGELDEAPGPWFWPGPALAVATIWGVNQWIDFCLSLSV